MFIKKNNFCIFFYHTFYLVLFSEKNEDKFKYSVTNDEGR